MARVPEHLRHTSIANLIVNNRIKKTIEKHAMFQS